MKCQRNELLVDIIHVTSILSICNSFFLFHPSLLLLQKEGSGLLPACLSVRLLLSICLQANASISVQPAEWEVCGAGPWSLPLLWSGAALHHPHQTQLVQEQLEL